MAPSIHSGSNHKAAATWNRQLVLRLFARHGQLSRRRIAEMVGLRGSTLTYIVREFLEQDILCVAGKARSRSVGQKQVLLEVNPLLGWTLGAALRPDRTRMVLYDAGGHRLGARDLGPIKNLEAAPRLIGEGLSAWRAEIDQLPGRMLGLGVGIPGVVDTERGMVLNSSLFGSRQTPLKSMLQEYFEGAAVVVDHDGRLGAVAEASEGAAKFARNFLYFIINQQWDGEQAHFHSFGSALFLDERVHRGAHFAAGELDGALAPTADFVLEREDVEAWSRPEGRLTEAMEQFARTLARPLASLVNLLDVPLIVLGGNARIANEAFIALLRGQVISLLIPGPWREVRILSSTLEGEAVARGAALAAAEAALGELCDRSAPLKVSS
jgi:predicted NBD/HSP70 family sugar kinase